MAARPHYAIVLPIHNEEECLGAVLQELADHIAADPGRRWTIAVGLNQCTDGSQAMAVNHDAVIGVTETRGYGYGCLAAIQALTELDKPPQAVIFCSGDGASDPADLPVLVDAFEAGHALVLGRRTHGSDLRGLDRGLANRLLGLWASLLGGRPFHDLGPFRIIDLELLQQIDPQELTWGWTIEMQVAAARLGASITEVNVRERPRMAGRQKVSGVSLKQTIQIGASIAQAGLRTWKRFR